MNQYVVTFGYFDYDGEYNVTKSKPIVSDSSDGAAALLIDQFETYEGLSCCVISVELIK